MKTKQIAVPGILIAFVILLITSCATSKRPKGKDFPEEKLGWKLGAQAYTFRVFTLEEALKKLDTAGLRHIELYPGQQLTANVKEKTGHNLSPEGINILKQLLLDSKVTVNAYGVVYGRNEEEWRKIFQFAKELTIPVIVCEPKKEHLDFLSALCDEYNIKIAIHNHPQGTTYWNPEIVLKEMEGRSKRIGAAADVGHWIRSSLNPVESLKKLEGRIYHIHFKDLNKFGDKSAHDVHWGTGVLGLTSVIQELKRQKYQGMISAEYEYNWRKNTNDVKVSAENFRKSL